jgi:hypothetical protein
MRLINFDILVIRVSHVALRALQWFAVEVQLETRSTAMLINQSPSIDIDTAKIIV